MKVLFSLINTREINLLRRSIIFLNSATTTIERRNHLVTLILPNENQKKNEPSRHPTQRGHPRPPRRDSCR